MNKDIKDMNREELVEYVRQNPMSEEEEDETIASLALGMCKSTGDYDVTIDDTRAILRMMRNAAKTGALKNGG